MEERRRRGAAGRRRKAQGFVPAGGAAPKLSALGAPAPLDPSPGVPAPRDPSSCLGLLGFKSREPSLRSLSGPWSAVPLPSPPPAQSPLTSREFLSSTQVGVVQPDNAVKRDQASAGADPSSAELGLGGPVCSQGCGSEDGYCCRC